MAKLKPLKILLIVLCVPILLAFLIAAYFNLPWLAIYIGILLGPNPPMPEITYGEFPFKLVYEIDGEQKVVEDIVVCEYDGIGSNEAVGKYRKWKKHLANSEEENVLLVTDGTRKIYCQVGSAEYYMNDEKYPKPRPFVPHLYLIDPNILVSEIGRKDEIIDSYNIKLISWEFTNPIVNNFK